MRQSGPSRRPWRGHSRRSVQGVWMRPMNTSPASVGNGASTAASPARISFSRTMALGLPVHRHRDVGGFHDRIGLLTDLEAEVVDGLVGDRGGDDLAVHVDADVRPGLALRDLDHLALEPIARADLHGVVLWGRL